MPLPPQAQTLREAMAGLAADLADVVRSKASALRALAATQDDCARLAEANRALAAHDGPPAAAALASVLTADTAAALTTFLKTHLGLADAQDRLPAAFLAAVRPTPWAAAAAASSPAPTDDARRALSALRTAVATRYAALTASGDVGRAELCCGIEQELNEVADALIVRTA